MDKLFPRRRILAGIATLALSAGAFAGAHADDATPLRIGVFTDMSSLYADITGPGSVAAAKMAVEDFLAGPHKMKRQIEVAERRSYEQGRSRSQHCPGVDRPQQCRSDHRRRRTHPWRSAVRNIVQQANKVILVSGCFVVRPHREILLAESRSLDLRYLCAFVGAARAVLAGGGKTWFTLTADYAFGHAMEAEVKNVVQKFGGTVVGGVRTPINSQDFSSFLLQAQASKSQIIGIDQCGRRHDQLDQAVGRVRHSAGWPAGRGDRALSQRRALPRTEGRTRSSVHRVVRLGPE